MKTMRPRLGALALLAALIAVISGGGGCKFAGVSAVYTSIDAEGAQRRTVFYTDSVAVYCIAKYSSAKQDTTVDFTIAQVPGPENEHPTHPIFAVDEETPGPGTEAIVDFSIPPNGIAVDVTCLGYCNQNGIGCQKGYTDEGDDSCGIGATCCFDAFSTSMAGPTLLPYPVGDYQCQVSIDGELVGTSDFSIMYPPPVCNAAGADCQECPVPPPVDGVICAGWVEPNSKCTGYDDTQMCTCAGAAWKCE